MPSRLKVKMICGQLGRRRLSLLAQHDTIEAMIRLQVLKRHAA
jgi:hypothetical protein